MLMKVPKNIKPKKRGKTRGCGALHGLLGKDHSLETSGQLSPLVYDHTGLHVWYGKEWKTLTLIHHSKKLKDWKINVGEHDVFIRKFDGTKLMSIRNYPEICDKSLISVLVERWHQERSAFHLPFGEMTITLDDVSQITGLKVEGNFITLKKLNHEAAMELAKKCLGVTDGAEINKEFKMANSIAYLQYFKNVDDIANIAFGTIALAFLFKELNGASKAKAKQIASMLALFEVWILEHFPTIHHRRPQEEYKEPEPRINKWKPCLGVFDSETELVANMQKLDRLTTQDVIMDPYSEYRQTTHQFDEITIYQGCIF